MPITIRNAFALLGLVLASFTLHADGNAPKPEAAKPASVAPARVQWEYKVEVNINERRMNQLGKEGWELVGFQLTSPRGGSGNTNYVFKRPNKPL